MSILFTDGTYHDDLLTGEVLEVKIEGEWVETSLEMDHKRQWYLTQTGLNGAGNLEFLEVRISP